MSRIQYETHTLANGLKVLIHIDRALPKAVVNVLYRVGSRNEDPEKTGFAHLFEHLMFGGSINIPSYDTPLQQAGGDNNAFTNPDLTNYYVSLPAAQLETGFWLESDRMLELDFSQRNLDVQKSVVIEEFKQRYLNKPYGDAHSLLRSLHFQVHPYQWPTIGKDISHIEKASLDDVRAFFYGYYAPNNATLIVTGDVDAGEVLRLAEKWFGPIPRRELLHKPLPQEPVQTEARSMTVHREVPYPAVYKMYHVPSRGTPGYYAADLLTDLLSNGRAARLYEALVMDQELCTSVRAFSWGAHDPGMISIDATLARGVSTQQYEDALAVVLQDLHNVDAAEIQRVRNSVETQYLLERSVLLNRTISLAMSDAAGDTELVNSAWESYAALTVEDVHAAARTYLRPENCSTLYYLPTHG